MHKTHPIDAKGVFSCGNDVHKQGVFFDVAWSMI